MVAFDIGDLYVKHVVDAVAVGGEGVGDEQVIVVLYNDHAVLRGGIIAGVAEGGGQFDVELSFMVVGVRGVFCGRGRAVAEIP